MPIVSKAQQRWAYWASEHGHGSERDAARDYVAAGPKGGSFKHLPGHVGGYDPELPQSAPGQLQGLSQTQTPPSGPAMSLSMPSTQIGGYEHRSPFSFAGGFTPAHGLGSLAPSPQQQGGSMAPTAAAGASGGMGPGQHLPGWGGYEHGGANPFGLSGGHHQPHIHALILAHLSRKATQPHGGYGMGTYGDYGGQNDTDAP